jgi:hypothetical protein
MKSGFYQWTIRGQNIPKFKYFIGNPLNVVI